MCPVVRDNQIREARILLDVPGDGHAVTDSCLLIVTHEYEHRSAGGLTPRLAGTDRLIRNPGWSG
jgi:hypothetical protein